MPSTALSWVSPPCWIAKQIGLDIDPNTKIIVAKIPHAGLDVPLSKEKLSPVLGMIVVNGEEEGFATAKTMLEIGGMGHSAAIHTGDMEMADRYGSAMPAGRIIVNSPSTHGGIGDIYNTNMPSLTLGCGSYARTPLLPTSPPTTW